MPTPRKLPILPRYFIYPLAHLRLRRAISWVWGRTTPGRVQEPERGRRPTATRRSLFETFSHNGLRFAARQEGLMSVWPLQHALLTQETAACGPNAVAAVPGNGCARGMDVGGLSCLGRRRTLWASQTACLGSDASNASASTHRATFGAGLALKCRGGRHLGGTPRKNRNPRSGIRCRRRSSHRDRSHRSQAARRRDRPDGPRTGPGHRCSSNRRRRRGCNLA